MLVFPVLILLKLLAAFPQEELRVCWGWWLAFAAGGEGGGWREGVETEKSLML